MKRGTYTGLLIFSALLIVLNAGIIYSDLDDYTVAMVTDLSCVLIAAVATAFGYIAYKKTSEKVPEERRILLTLTIAFAFRTLGEIMWTYYEVYESSAQYVSIADIFWYISYILVIIAFSKRISEIFIPNKARVVGKWMFAATAVSGLIAWIEISQINQSLEDLIYHLILETYVFFDIYIIALLMIVLQPMLKDYNDYFKATVISCFGFIAFGIFDFLYVRAVLAETYVGGQIIDVIYILAYILVIFGFYYSSKSVSDEKEETAWQK